MRKALTVKQVCEQLSICRQSVYKLIQQGELDAKRTHGKWLILSESVDRYLDSDNLYIEKILGA